MATPTAPENRLAERLESDVRALADGIGERSLHVPGSLASARDWLMTRLRSIGYRPDVHAYELTGDGNAYAGRTAENVIAEVPGSEHADEIVIIGAHYDSVAGSPGANDNASGIAVLLALAEWFVQRPQPRTVRFLAFVNEEPPFHHGRDMGSRAYAARSRKHGEHVFAMVAMDGLGYFSDQPGSQLYPLAGIGAAYPHTGNFIGIVTRPRDAGLMRQALGAFRRCADMPVQGVALPSLVPGVGWSDHRSFWEHGYPALMVTDTLPFRDPAYHTSGDTPERLDYARMAQIATGMQGVTARLCT